MHKCMIYKSQPKWDFLVTIQDQAITYIERA